MSNLKDLTGQKFGRLTVIERAGSTKDNHTTWLCGCECGNKTVVPIHYLRSGNTKSCGCLKNEFAKIHGMSDTRIFRIWEHMKSRCYNKSNQKYSCYGERGIKVCDEWLNDFQAFYDWSMKNGYADNLSIDRIDVNGNYEPNNCRWADAKQQANNRTNSRYITYNGKTQTMSQWAEELGINRKTLECRIMKYNWTVERAFNTK